MTRFFSYFFIFLGVAVLVPFIFQWIPERRIAAVVAGTLFVVVPFFILFHDWRAPKLDYLPRRTLIVWRFALVQFLGLFALPIFYGRLANWGLDFRDVLIMGIPGPVLHRFSNASFLLMMVATLVIAGIELWLRRKKVT